MAIRRVWLDENDNECIACGACEMLSPEVFAIPDKMVVKRGVDFNKFEPQIIEAAEICPTEVIKYE